MKLRLSITLIIKDRISKRRLPRANKHRWRIEWLPGRIHSFKKIAISVLGSNMFKIGCDIPTALTLLVHPWSHLSSLTNNNRSTIQKFRYLLITRQDSVKKFGLLDHIHFLVNGILTKIEAMVESEWSGPKATIG